jgi:hypothetical protein
VDDPLVIHQLLHTDESLVPDGNARFDLKTGDIFTTCYRYVIPLMRSRNEGIAQP